MHAPLCFVLMPFGSKPDGSGRLIDFGAVYQDLIAPAIVAAGLEPLRADEELAGGLIHKPMYERLILCEFAVADLSTANANVLYELGVRHAVRPHSTVLIYAVGTGQLSFDIAPLRAIPYQLSADGKPMEIGQAQTVLAERLRVARQGHTDSPIYQLVDGFPDIQHLKTDVFRARIDYSIQLKQELAAARRAGLSAIHAIEAKLHPIADAEAGVVIDLFLSYRAVKAWQAMIDLVEKMAKPLAATVLVREQWALALNRAGQGEMAESVLLELIEQRGPSSETYGILGRVYKDRWEAAHRASNMPLARGLLSKAINAYLKGFEADWRDAYPGINAVTLMELQDNADPRSAALLPVVRYAVERRVAGGKPDYWDYATRLELAVLAKDETAARDALAAALAALREPWEAETTARNLRLIREARERRGEVIVWTLKVEQSLEQHSVTK